MNRFPKNGSRFICFLLLVTCLSPFTGLRGEEGMWIPMLLERFQIESMQEAGLRLDAEDIYSVNQDCLKDAVVIFNGGCTAAVISEEGLLLTNHHCGKSVISAHSTLEHDYLTGGFWAMSREEELPNPSVFVTFLRYMKDVTMEVREGIVPGMEEEMRARRMDLNMGRIIRDATRGTYLEADVVPFFYGNEYYLFVYEVFTDVRLVGAPPLAVGNFGGDTDNWMWPRHAGDFSLFRIYADQENRPAAYSPSNRPYIPRKSLEISTSGVSEGDFTMILGYPGRTTQYLHSEGIRQLMGSSLPLNTELRGFRLAVMDRYMEASDTVRLRYLSKYYSVSNAWKKWQGTLTGFRRLDLVERKLEEEEAFREWVESDGERLLKYEGVLDRIGAIYAELRPYTTAMDLLEEAIDPVEVFRQVNAMLGMMITGSDPDRLEEQVRRFCRSFYLPVDREVFAAMMSACYNHLPEDLQPPFFRRVARKFNNDFEQFALDVYRRSVFSDSLKVLRICDLYRRTPHEAIERLLSDPLASCIDQFGDVYMARVRPEHDRLQEALSAEYRTYMRGLMEMAGERRLYADANFTMRVTYGQVSGYEPSDGVKYGWSTNLSGVMEKGAGNPENSDYLYPDRLKQLYIDKDFGPYGVDGTMPVCFTASNHTSGGNSGSPVLNGEGQLIGLNFDRNWEGTVSDYRYDPEVCRNISVDIRYILFIIDRYAGAGYLLDEMNIAW